MAWLGERPGKRARRRKRRRDFSDPEPPVVLERHRKPKARRRYEAEVEAGSDEPRWRRRESAVDRPVTCLQCVNLVIARSRAKMIGESWDNAVVFPTYSCYE